MKKMHLPLADKSPRENNSDQGEEMSRGSLFRLLLVFPICLFMGSCGRATPPPPVLMEAPPVIAEPAPERITMPSDVATVWHPLIERLANDGIVGSEVNYLFMRLGEAPSQDPMGRKVKELYTSKFLKPAPKAPSAVDTTPPSPSGIPKPWYKGVVTDANARRCRTFINTHDAAFAEAEQKYSVPTEVAAALLFVETRLGDYLGKENVFLTLASMSASDTPDAIPDWLDQLPGVDKRLDWVAERMVDKSNWAYTELRALIQYSLENGVDPYEIPGSIYGALGLCQFMPSNISRFAVDGSDDGVIDLFAPADAVASLSNYLVRNGWKPGMSQAEQRKILKRYNNLNIYANTILALAEKINTIPGRPQVNRPLPKGPVLGAK